MKTDLDNPGAVKLTGRCDGFRRQPHGSKLEEGPLVVLGVSLSLAIFLFVLWLIIHRGPAH